MLADREGRKRLIVSVLGDSLSTFEGYQPPDYTVYYDREKQKANGMVSIYDMWWAKVNSTLHAYICVNNSYSGRKVAGLQFPAGNSEKCVSSLHTDDYRPDLILVYLGFNDFGYGVPLEADKTLYEQAREHMAFYPAYCKMLAGIKKHEPQAKIVCGTIMRTTIYNRPNFVFPEYYHTYGLEAYNRLIRQAVQDEGCLLADVSAIDRPYETLDGTHATAAGHTTMAENWLLCLRKLLPLEADAKNHAL